MLILTVISCNLAGTWITANMNPTDCWAVKSGRDPVTGRILPDTTKFPEGIKGTADKIHAMGLKIGIYSDAGVETCAGYPGSLYYEHVDAQTFEEWGIDCTCSPKIF